MASTSDVLVIGAGVIGTSIAYHSAQRGLRVTVLDRSSGPVEPTASWASAGGVRRQGRHPAEAALASAAIQRWPDLSAELDADVHYRQGGQLLLAENDQEAEQLVQFVAKQQAMGFQDVCLVDRKQAYELVPGLNADIVAGSYSPSDGQADAASTARAFAQAAERLGAAIWVNTPVRQLLAENGRVIGVDTPQGKLYAEQVVLAAGAWGARLLAQIGVDLPIRTEAYQMLLSTAAEQHLRPVIGTLGRALSLKQLDDGRFLIGGGHPGDVAADGDSCTIRAASQAASWRTASELLPMVGQQQLERAWCGLEALCYDEIPLIGQIPEYDRLVLALGFSGHGFAIAPAVGQAVSEVLLGRATPMLSGLNPARITQFDPDRVAAFKAGADLHLPG